MLTVTHPSATQTAASTILVVLITQHGSKSPNITKSKISNKKPKTMAANLLSKNWTNRESEHFNK